MGYLDKLKAKADSNAAGELKMLPLEALEPSSRNFYRMCEIDQLADSIAANGLEQNLVVKAEAGGKYRIVTGHRRYQALLRLVSRGVRVQTVPCIVRPAETEAQEMLRMIASNQYRELTDYEKMVQVEQATTAVKTLRSVKMAELGGIRLDGPTREVVSRLTGMSGPAVSKYAGIAEKLIPELKARMEQGLLPFTVAYAACRYPAGWQMQVFKQHQLACDAGPVSEALVTGVAYSNAVKEALYSSVSDTIDPTVDEAGNVERLKRAWCRHNASASIPGAGFVDCAPDKITITGAGNNWRVEMTPTRFVIVALGMWKSMCTGRWKQEEARKRFKDVSREALDRMDAGLRAGATAEWNEGGEASNASPGGACNCTSGSALPTGGAAPRQAGELEELPEACVQDETSEKTEGAACGPMTSIGPYKGERQAAEGLPSSAAAAAPLPLWPTATSPVPGESVPTGEGLGELPPVPAAEEAESGVSRTPPPTDDPADTEEEAVESGRFGELRNALSGKSAALEDKAWDQIIVWNREPPPEDVYAVVHYRIEDSEMEELAYWHKNRGVWSMDRNGAYALEADVLGWFRVPKWEG